MNAFVISTIEIVDVDVDVDVIWYSKQNLYYSLNVSLKLYNEVSIKVWLGMF